MIFSGPVKECSVSVFTCLVNDEADQLVVVQMAVQPDKQEVGLFIPIPGDARLVSTYDAHIDHVSDCFADEEYNPLRNDAARHRTHVAPCLFHNFDALVNGTYCPENVREWLRTHYCAHSFLYVPFAQETASHPFAYVHPARADKRLFVPAKQYCEDPQADVECDCTVFTVNTTTLAGIPPVTQRFHTAFRWDLIRGVAFPVIESLRMFVHTGTQSNTDMLLPTLSTPIHERLYIGGDGSLFHDKTRLRIVQFVPTGLRTYPMINGAYLTNPGEADPFHFGGSNCSFEEVLVGDEWCVAVIDNPDTDSAVVSHVRPWKVRHVYGRAFIDLEDQEQ